jgi:hypothetical protein
MPHRTLAIDQMVDFLVSENKYWEHVVSDPRLWGEKKAMHASVQENHKRKCATLAHYVDRTTSSSMNEPSTAISGLIMLGGGDISLDMPNAENTGMALDEDGIINLIGFTQPLQIKAVDDPLLTKKKRYTRKSLLLHEVCPQCKETK